MDVWHGRRCSKVATDITLVARRKKSLSSGGRLLVLGFLATVFLAVSLEFALSGALPILPFAGMELLAVGPAFLYMKPHAGDLRVHNPCTTIRS